MQRSYTGSIDAFKLEIRHKTDKLGRKHAAVRKTISNAEPGGAFSGRALIYYIPNFVNPLRNIVLFKVEFGYTYDIVYTCGISGYSIDKQLGFMGVV